MAQWREHSPPTNVARSNPDDETMCEISLLLVVSLAQRGFSPRPPSFRLLKTNTSKLQFYLDTDRRLNEFIRTPKWFVGKQLHCSDSQLQTT